MLVFLEVTAEFQTKIVESLAREIWTEHYLPIIGKMQLDYMLDKFQSKQAISGQISSGFRYFLMQENADFIGYISVQPRGTELFLSKIYVRKARRGKGFGKKAVNFAESLAQEMGLQKIVLTVYKNNIKSILAYEKMGFMNVGSLVQDIGNGFFMDDYQMEKTIRRS